MATPRLRWRYFWSRRSQRRTLLALVFALAGLLATIYLALPPDGQRQVVSGLLTVAHGLSLLGPRPVLAVGVALCIVLSLAFIFVPSYRRHSYLTTAPSIVPPVSVYLDAENQLPEAAIRPFIEFLIKHLDGRRADLLYFLDASQTAKGEKYKTLYRFGFRPVDVPHDPTGKGAVKEAVDRELAMHAYERAVLGPQEQEFIIVTGDGDFVPLIYRLAALGHRVQIWATPVRKAYRVVETYLGVNVIDLSQVISELEIVPSDVPPAPSSTPSKKPSRPAQRRQAARRSNTSLPRRIPAPTALSQPGEQHLYYAVAETLAAHAEALDKHKGDLNRNGQFHALIRGAYGPRMAGVGYSVGNWLDYWLEHLIALDVLLKVNGQAFPRRGPTSEESAARSLLAMSKAAANAAILVGSAHEDGVVRVSEVSAALAAQDSPVDEAAAPLFKFLALETGRRITHVRYFVRSARALGLLEFDDVPNSLDLIAHPRLPAATPASTEQAEVLETTGDAAGTADTAVSHDEASSTLEVTAVASALESQANATADSPETEAETAAVVDAVGVQVGGQRYGDQPNHRGDPDIPA